VPLIAIFVVRLCRAVASTIRLLTDVEVMKALPWPYIRRLPLRNRFVGFAALCLVISFCGLVVAAVVPGAQFVTLGAAATGLLVSYARAVGRNRIRRR
jgi:hypothetical protein